jgi:hypothetical protein
VLGEECNWGEIEEVMDKVARNGIWIKSEGGDRQGMRGEVRFHRHQKFKLSSSLSFVGH